MEGLEEMKKTMLLLFVICFIGLFLPNHKLAAENLQPIIDSAEEGAVIQLEDQTYEGNIVINKSIKIIGTSQTIIKGDGTGNVISVHAPQVTLKKLTVVNGGMDRNSPEEYAAIKIHSDGNLLDQITIRDFFHGVYLSQSHHNIIKNVDVKGLGKGEIANQGNGLHVYYSNHNQLENNRIEGTRDGMFFDYANHNTVKNNTISETRYGLHYMYSDYNILTGNTFTFNTGGAAIMHSNGITLGQNEFIFNYGHRSFGLLLLSSNQTTIENNTFFLNQRGLYIDQSTDNKITQNRIVKNQVGIELWASSNDQIFTQNQIYENTIPAVSLGGQGRNHWSEDHIGNDWGKSFPLLDLNQDGIGDQPITYQSSLYQLIEDQELTYLFLKSPAIAVYEKMNKLFHKEKVMFEDSYPIVSKRSNQVPWIWIVLVGVVTVTFIIIKGRNQLCTTFGKNGRKA